MLHFERSVSFLPILMNFHEHNFLSILMNFEVHFDLLNCLNRNLRKYIFIQQAKDNIAEEILRNTKRNPNILLYNVR